jgi:hypothetical protein
MRSLLILALSISLMGCSAVTNNRGQCVEKTRQIKYHTAVGLALPIMHETCVRYEVRSK